MPLSMKADIKKRWIKELESGEYTQGAGNLHERGYDIPNVLNEPRPDKFCCLGVLCKMAHDEGVVDVSNEDEPGTIVYYNGEGAYLPPKVIEWAGLSYVGERLISDQHFEEQRGVFSLDDESLVEMNDKGRPFEVIANTIRGRIVGV
jgi:hypothetical protein